MNRRCERKLRRQALILKLESQRYKLSRLRHAWLVSMTPADNAWNIASRYGPPFAVCGGMLILRRVKKQRKNPLRLLHYISKAAGIWTTVRFVHRSLAPKM